MNNYCDLTGQNNNESENALDFNKTEERPMTKLLVEII